MLHRLPLATLHTFIIVAESQSFTEAGQKLFLTQGAISKQMKQLEQYLDMLLFQRHTHHISLTEEGSLLYHYVKPALLEIQQGIWQVQQKDRYTLHIHSAPTFATRWLAIHLHDFHYQYPQVSITLTDIALQSQNQADCTISFSEQAPQAQAICLMHEHNVAVCASHLFETDLNKLFLKYQLLHILHDNQRLNLWSEWMHVANLNFVTETGLNFSTQDQVINATVNGLGLAIVDQNMITYPLRHRELFAISEHVLIGPYAYWLENHATDNRAAEWFCNWIQSYINNIN